MYMYVAEIPGVQATGFSDVNRKFQMSPEEIINCGYQGEAWLNKTCKKLLT